MYDNDSHEEIIKHFKITPDGRTGVNVVRVEVIPPKNWGSCENINPLTWFYKVDQDVTPEWHDNDPELTKQRVKKAMEDFKENHMVWVKPKKASRKFVNLNPFGCVAPNSKKAEKCKILASFCEGDPRLTGRNICFTDDGPMFLIQRHKGSGNKKDWLLTQLKEDTYTSLGGDAALDGQGYWIGESEVKRLERNKDGWQIVKSKPKKLPKGVR
jgi:hypothetical protein